MALVEDFSGTRIPAIEERNLKNYYVDRLFACEMVLHTLIETVDRAVPQGSLFGLVESFRLAYSASADRLAEVEEYIVRLEGQVRELSVRVESEQVEPA